VLHPGRLWESLQDFLGPVRGLGDGNGEVVRGGEGRPVHAIIQIRTNGK